VKKRPHKDEKNLSHLGKNRTHKDEKKKKKPKTFVKKETKKKKKKKNLSPSWNRNPQRSLKAKFKSLAKMEPTRMKKKNPSPWDSISN